MRYSQLFPCSPFVLLAACAGATLPPAGTQAVEAAPTATSEIAADLAVQRSDLPAESAGAPVWLQSFDDPELEKIVAEALLHNPGTTLASARLKTAERLAAQAGAALTAAIAGGGADDTEHAAAASNSVGVALNLQWELDIWDRLGSIAAASGDASRPSPAELEAARLSLAAQAAKAWFLATETNLQLALSQQAVEIHEQRLRDARARADAGDAAAEDVAVVEAELEASRERQRRAIGALVQALRSIEVILGRYPSAELLEVREYMPGPPPVPAGIPALLLERRADLDAAARRVAQAFQRPQSARTAELPRLPLTTTAGTASEELTGLLAGDGAFFSRGANFLATLDDSDGGESITGSALRQTALQDYAALARRVFHEVAAGLDSEARLRQREASLAASAEATAGMLAAARSRYQEDARTLPDMLRLEAQALDNRIRLTRVRHARLARRIDLHLALGGDFSR